MSLRSRTWVRVLGALAAGIGVFVGLTVAFTVVLDPLVWPSLIVSIPIGLVGGVVAIAVAYSLLTRWGEGPRTWRTVAISAAIVLVLLVAVLGGLSVLGEQRIEESYDSTYSYEVTLDTDETLDQPTVYVPIPVENGTSEIGDQFVAEVTYYRDSYASGPASPDPVNFTYELVETDHGPTLAISADRIEVTESYFRVVENDTMGWTEPISREEYDPTDPSMGVRDNGRFTFEVTLVADHRIDTADPFDDEPLLSTAADRVEADCRPQFSDTQRCYEFESHIYADYDTAENASVFLSVHHAGRNEWFSGGWSGNEYRERTSVELLGPQSGWHRTSGELVVGEGSYRR